MLLTISNLYPRPDEPDRGLFNMQFFERLSPTLAAGEGGVASGGILNVCLVPSWRVWKWKAIRSWLCPHNVSVRTHYLPAFYIPVIGRNLSWATYVWALRRVEAEAQGCGAILATWLYPDVVAAAELARRVGRPLWIKLHGSDILHLRNPGRRDRILEACKQAAGLFCVSRPLAAALCEEGVDPAKIHYVPNGVDKSLFTCGERTSGRQEGGGKTVLFVGHLVEVKGPDILLKAWRSLQQMQERGNDAGRGSHKARLVFVGEGSMRQVLEKRAQKFGVADSVTFHGVKPHSEIPQWMRRADCLCLSSRSEGMPNVVLESLACGTPVVATDVGAVPFLVEEGVSGRIVPRGAGLPRRLAETILGVLNDEWDHQRIAAGMAGYTWEKSAETAARLLGKVVSKVL